MSAGDPMAMLDQEFRALPPYYEGSGSVKPRAGDIIVQFDGDTRKAHHSGIVSKDGASRIHSVYDGVKKANLPNGPAVVYRYARFVTGLVGRAAAGVAEGWVDSVGYSSVNFFGFETVRSIRSFLGSGIKRVIEFGPSARGRLRKYRARQGWKPKNVICSELVVLAYQLSINNEDAPSFIKLDAKYTMPWNLEQYLYQHEDRWQRLARIEVGQVRELMDDLLRLGIV